MRKQAPIASMCVGIFLIADLLDANFSLWNTFNFLKVMVGVAFVLYGAYSWEAPSRKNEPLPADCIPDSWSQDKSQDDTPPPKSLFELFYLGYLKYLLLAPLFILIFCWIISVKLSGCRMSAASMKVYGCDNPELLLFYLGIYAGILIAAAFSLFVPLTIVYAVHIAGKKK